ncbi:hypothetical protein BX600DRAFT_443198 [Xylariales sp. PMI_506]|nr:hypothetical protein BX600DRAFT_443198 [Xylariales sp. PMI_506]
MYDTVPYWPERLLHVPTMQSVKRSGDARYGKSGNIIKPHYATLSYTWARFQKSGEAVLQIHGLAWEIPSIDQAHFTANRFLTTIKTIAKVGNLEYIWLDVACMNFTPLQYSDPEVTRQLDIFMHAHYGGIWLTRTSIKHLERAKLILMTSLGYVQHGTEKISQDQHNLTYEAGQLLLEIMRDPWFSSMWTLLESSLKPDAVLISAEGSLAQISFGNVRCSARNDSPVIADENWKETLSLPVQRRTNSGHHHDDYLPRGTYLSFQDLVSIAGLALGRMPSSEGFGAESNRTPISDEVISAVEKSGLYSFKPLDFNYIYRNIWYREEMKSGDKVRFIHTQVFRCQAESPSQPNSPPTNLSVAVGLRKQFLIQFPVLSQLFLRSKPSDKGFSWIVTPDCKLIDFGKSLTYFKDVRKRYTITETPALSNERSILKFQGYTCDFSKLANSWMESGGSDPSILHLSLDHISSPTSHGAVTGSCRTDWLQYIVNKDTEMDFTDLKQEQKNRIRCISTEIDDLGARVLLLAYAAGSTCSLAFGVIMVKNGSMDGKSVWKRIGLAIWVFTQWNQDNLPAGDMDDTCCSDSWSWGEGFLG